MLKDYKDIYDMASSMTTSRIAVVHPRGSDLLEALETAEKLGWVDPVLVNERTPEESAFLSLELIKNGKADLLMKGDLDTSLLLKAVLDPEGGIRTETRLSHIAVVESPNYDRLMLFTDGGVNTTIEDPIAGAIIENALSLSNRLQISKPNVAVLALVEKLSTALPETAVADSIFKQYQNDPRMVIEGPVPLDIALSARAATIKGVASSIAGKTDIFIGPSISVTNFTVKGLLALGNAKGGGLVLGAKVPIILLSRSDSAETKLNSIALGVVARKGDL